MRRLIAAVCVIAGSVFVPMASPAAAGGGCHEPAPTEGAGSTVEMSGACFAPTVLRVEPGATVAFVNRDEFEHDLSGTSLASFDRLSAGDVVEHQFDRPGTYPYMCALHPGMTGAVIVGDGRGSGRAASVERPVLAGTTRAVTTGGVHPVVVGIAAGLGLGAGALLQRKRAARA